jgi:hypothetical protein
MFIGMILLIPKVLPMIIFGALYPILAVSYGPVPKMVSVNQSHQQQISIC